MAVIGIYDSGIGGLTTLAELSAVMSGADFYYLADNKNMPFGCKSDDEIEEIVASGLKKLEAHSDVSVLACNTASVTTRSREVFKLLPVLEGLEPFETLVLATPLTLRHIAGSDFMFRTADTRELASLVEIQANVDYKLKNNLDMSALRDYLKIRLKDLCGIKNVVLGCSHYVFVKKEIASLVPGASMFDGNAALAKKVKKYVSPDGRKSGKIFFDFTGYNESKKYKYIFEKLKKATFFRG